MPVASTMVWEVRTTGSITNGGGFNPATGTNDYSQQDLPQYSLAVTSSAAGNDILTPLASADMVGNVGFIVAGGTNLRSSYYEILSVVPGVSITLATDSLGLSVSSGIGSGTFNIGGALDALENVLKNGAAPGPQAGNMVYVKAGTYTKAATNTIAVGNANVALRIFVIGYNTDRSKYSMDVLPVTLTSATNSINILTFNASPFLSFRNFRIQSTAATRGHGVVNTGAQTADVRFERCTFSGLNSAFQLGSASSSTINPTLYECTITGCALAITQGNTTGDFVMVGGQITGCTSRISTSGTAGKLISLRKVLVNNNTNGFEGTASTSSSGSLNFSQCTFANNGSYTIKSIISTGNFVAVTINDCIFYGSTGYLIDFPAATGTTRQFSGWDVVKRNAYGGAALGIKRGFGQEEYEIILTADPFVNAAGGDYNLNNVAGGGALCRNAALNNFDLGYIDRVNTGGSGTTLNYASMT